MLGAAVQRERVGDAGLGQSGRRFERDRGALKSVNVAEEAKPVAPYVATRWGGLDAWEAVR